MSESTTDEISEAEIEEVSLNELNWEDGKYQKMPPLPDDEYNSLKNKIKEEGFDKAHPIIADEEGYVIDGHHRCKICDELSIDSPWVYRKEGLSHEEKIKSSYKENTARRNLGNGEKREAAKNFYKEDYNGESLRDIANMIGVSRGTVSNAKNELTEVEEGVFEELPNLNTVDEPEEEMSNLDTPDEPQEVEFGKNSLDSFSQHIEAAQDVIPLLDSEQQDAAGGIVQDLLEEIDS